MDAMSSHSMTVNANKLQITFETDIKTITRHEQIYLLMNNPG